MFFNFIEPDIYRGVIFTKGVAGDISVQHLLAETLEQEIKVPDDPKVLGALGAALLTGE